MIAHPTLGVGIGLVLISFFATSNAGMLSEIQQKLNQNTNIKNIELFFRYLPFDIFVQEHVLR